MDWLSQLVNTVKNSLISTPVISASVKTPAAKKPVFNSSHKTEHPREIKMSNDISDAQITRSNYITVVKNPDHKVKSGENISKISAKYGIEARTLMAANGLNEKSVLKLGQVLKIPPTRKVKNVKNINDIAKVMGVSPDFIKKLKSAEDSAHLPANKFHNTPYKDKGGVDTIGIGHVLKPGEPRNLTDAQVC
ncbi:MAG: LysM peptidoglycan-binding domain-containing protein, partial [Candidatus Gastranaerophilales bacterium]|nr:LysM peptidoglycan-binding domain-containing protein [Candidatus Gastranaerophilales bacterium]